MSCRRQTIISSYFEKKIFLAEAQQRLDPLGRAVRERVAKSLAVSESIVARVLAAYNVHGEEAFAVPADAHQGGAYVEQPPPSEIAPAPTMEELQDLAGEASDKVHCSNIMGEMDTSAQFEEFEIAL
ncbi:hypothetical protein GQ600_16540 [Phytophthora cactorum]|nr:hypothetical protein GQ600_16540 [Phytophthora cactorum]